MREDQAVLLYHQAGADGKQQTAAYLKIRDKAASKLDALTKGSKPAGKVAGPSIDSDGTLMGSVVQALKGIKVNSAAAGGLRAKRWHWPLW